MGMPQLTQTWDRTQVLALPDDGRRYELVHGDLLVSPSPTWRHQNAVTALVTRLRAWCDWHKIGLAMVSPADLSFDGRQLLQPDVFVAPLVGGRRPASWSDVTVPLLVVEVLSPSTARYDRLVKRAFYQRSGVPEYWIVDLDARLVERWHPTDDRPEILTDQLAWQPDPGQPPLIVDLAALFAEIGDQ
jgi:Uma2 family endonuclease